jgi:hypothetical protein
VIVRKQSLGVDVLNVVFRAVCALSSSVLLLAIIWPPMAFYVALPAIAYAGLLILIGFQSIGHIGRIEAFFAAPCRAAILHVATAWGC